MVLSVPLPAAQATAADPLQSFLTEVKTLRAHFEQELTAEDGVLLQRAQGEFTLVRPGRFRWEYRVPYRQTIVADGRSLWLYDPDLAQVTVQPLDQVLGSAPARLLSGAVDVAADFDVRDEGVEHDLHWIALQPRRADAEFIAVRLGFDADHLARMELRDSFGQVTRLVFFNVETNLSIEPESFHFVPPDGVDVLGQPG